MGTQRTAFKIALTLWLLAAPAMAQVPPLEPLNLEVRYDVYWNGLPLGRVRITAKEDDFTYKLVVDSKTRGLADIFAESKSVAFAQGRMADGEYIASRYESRSDSENKRHTVMTYDETGAILTRDRTPQDDPAWRPVVPLSEANTATDPITAFFVLRQRMHQNIASNIKETQVKTYEGARLALFDFTVVSRASLKIMKQSVNAINIVPKRTILNGYTPKEQKKFAKGDPTVHVYFSADGRFIPLLAEVKLPFGTLKAELTEVK